MANMYINAMTALWNNVGTVYSAIKMNVTDSESAASSKLLDLRVSDVNMFNVSKTGNTYAAGDFLAGGDVMATGRVVPQTTNTTALGAEDATWSDLFLGIGGEINFGAGATGAMKIHHTADDGLFVSGTHGLRLETAGTEPTSVVTMAGTQTLTNKTITGGTINSANFSTTDGQITIGSATLGSAASIGRTIPTGSTVIMGGDTTGGGYLQLYGATHADSAKDYGLFSGSGGNYRFDNSANKHQFKNNAGTVLFEIGPSGISSITSVGNVNGSDFHAVRASAPTTGVIYLGNSGSRYLHYDGSDYVLSGANLSVSAINTTSAVRAASGNVHFWLQGPAGEDRGVIYTTATGAAGNLNIRNASQYNWSFGTDAKLTCPGRLAAATYFQSTTASAILSGNGGNIYLRPNGPDSPTEQVYVNSNGTMVVDPTVATGLVINAPTTSANHSIRSYGISDGGAVVGYSYPSSAPVYGMLGYYDILTGADAKWSFYGNGNARTSGTWQTSDQRLKSEIADCDCGDAYEKVRAIGVKSYRKQHAVRGRDYDEMGFLAQDIEQVIPEAVMDAGIPKSETAEREQFGDTIKLTNDHTLLAHLWAAVQHQAHIIDGLNSKIEALGGNR